ncbi:MAG: hypothetical protein AAF533_14260 [Acidobacteriota bacterium]
MFHDLDRIDIVTEGDAGQMANQTDHRPRAEVEATPELSTLMALTRCLNPRRMSEEVAGVMHVVSDRDVAPLLSRVVAATGGTLELISWGDDAPEEGEALEVPAADATVDELLVEAFDGLARGLLEGEDAATCLRRREEALLTGSLPNKDEDPLAFWTAALELSALSGLALSAHHEGQWVHHDETSSPIPFAFMLKDDKGTLVNLTGRSVRFVAGGEGDRPSGILAAVDSLTAPGQERPMAFIRPASWRHREPAPVFEPLVADVDAQDVPLIVYGSDSPMAMGFHRADTMPDADLGELRAKALETIRAIELEMQDAGFPDATVLVGEVEHAESKILDEDFLRGLQEQLGSPAVLLGVPACGLMFAMDPSPGQQALALLAHVCESVHAEADERVALVPFPIMVADGRPIGFVQAG